jgi:hypothetical protein
MHRHSDETVAASVLAAVAELRRRTGHLGPAGPCGPDGEAGPELAEMAGRVRLIRAGVLPRDQYESARGPGGPAYADLPAHRHDEDRLAWLITQALTGIGD